MSRSDNYGLPESYGKSFSHEDDIPQDNHSERLIPSLCCSGTSLPPPLPRSFKPYWQANTKMEGMCGTFIGDEVTN